MFYYIYIVLCEDGSFYTGVTDNPDRRFVEHSSGKGGHHTKRYSATEILHTEKFSSKSEALRRERQIKGWRREKKLNLIKFGKPFE